MTLTAAILIFCVAALLYYQSSTLEHFSSGEVKNMMNPWATWNPHDPPIAGRSYNPNRRKFDKYNVPSDLNRAPVSQPGAFPTASDNKPSNVPGPMNTTRQTLAQAKDLTELDSKITTWLAAASQRENEAPGSLTSQQLEQRIILQARLEDVRQQLGLNQVTDNYSTVADEIRALRRENANWQHRTPYVSDAFDCGKGVNPDALLTKDQYDHFFGILGAGIKEFGDLYQPEPLQKVRYQQLQVIRQSLVDSSSPTNPPPIRMAAAQLFLRQMLRPEQPLPTLFSVDFIKAGLGSSGFPGSSSSSGLGSFGSFGGGLEMNSDDVMDQLRNIQWKLTVSYDPAEQEMKRAAASLMERIRSGQISVVDARGALAQMDLRRRPAPLGYPGDIISPFVSGPVSAVTEKHADVIAGANRLCAQIKNAFPKDYASLGCARVTTAYEGEAVINTVCDRIRDTVPSVTPEQFNCPALKQISKKVCNRKPDNILAQITPEQVICPQP